MFLDIFYFLITYQFWSKLGFFISYIATMFLVLEILRLVYTDSNKREVEKMLDAYTHSRTETLRPRHETTKISIDDLEKRPQTPQRRTSSPAVTPESERTLVNEARRRRAMSVLQKAAPAPAVTAADQTQTPPRKLRKRSDTLNSAGSAELRGSVRRRREGSPASFAGSKASSRHVSPTPKSRDAQKVASSLQKLLRTKV